MGEEKTYETQFGRLQEIVRKLEAGSASLEESVALYKEGAALVKDCQERLEGARNAVEVFSAGVFAPFADGQPGEERRDGGEE